LYYAGVPFSNNQDLGLATSVDNGETWTKVSDLPLVSQAEKPYWATQRLVPVRALHEDGLFKLWYWGNNTNLFTQANNIQGFGYGESVDGLSWTLTEEPIRVESGASEGARLLELVKLNNSYLAYYLDITSDQPLTTYLATSPDGETFFGPDERILFGDAYNLAAATTLPGNNGCFVGMWRNMETGAYVATTSANGRDFEIVSNITFPSGFQPEDFVFDGDIVTVYGQLSEGNINWSYGNHSIAKTSFYFFEDTLPAPN
jgi:hypothetical protein